MTVKRPLPENADWPIEFSCELIPKVTEASDAHVWKALSSIVVTASGIATERRPLRVNAYILIFVSELGRSSVFKAVQPSKARVGILVQPAGMVTSPFTSGVI